MLRIKLSSVVMLVVTALAVPLRCEGYVHLAVKRGQKTVDPKTLPFACIAVTTDGIAVPIQKIVFQDLTTHKDMTAMLSKTFSTAHPDVLTAIERGSRSVSLAILRFKPGRYEVRSIEFNHYIYNGVGSLTLDLTQLGHFRFTVLPGVVNYAGTIAIAADWSEANLRIWNDRSAISVERSFPAQVTIEATAKRDEKWAADVVPCMGTLPSVESLLQNDGK